MAVQVRGLMRVYEGIQAQLRAGIAPAEQLEFRRNVDALVRQVEAICRQHRATPDQLPAPSRRAYRFLKSLDLTALPPRPTDTPAPRSAPIRLANLVATSTRLAERLWQERSASDSSPTVQEIGAEITRHVRGVEKICLQRAATPAALATPSRTAYCWLKFLSSAGNLALHLQALRRASEAIASAVPPGRASIAVMLTNTAVLCRVRRSSSATIITVNEGFLPADADVWSALIAHTLGLRNSRVRQIVDQFAMTEAYSGVLYELSEAARPPTAVRGRIHDLDASFDRVNAAYFDGKLTRPVLHWSTTPTARTFGHYQTARDTLMVSVSLDDATVPDFVVDYVMYHELLHKQLGVTLANGRHNAHGADFRAAERRYKQFAEAEAFLQTFAASL